MLAPDDISAATSSAGREGVWRRDSTSSPKALRRIDVLKEFVAAVLPGLQPAAERANVAVAQGCQRLACRGHEVFAGIVEDNQRILARQPCLGFERDPVRCHVRGKQGMAGGESGLMSKVKNAISSRINNALRTCDEVMEDDACMKVMDRLPLDLTLRASEIITL